jgi:hypothetical protein
MDNFNQNNKKEKPIAQERWKTVHLMPRSGFVHLLYNRGFFAVLNPVLSQYKTVNISSENS